jgi:FkbM family methyltransferase
MASFSNVHSVLRDRGPAVLATALCQLARGALYKNVLRRRFIERRVHSYRMLLDMTDKGISRSLLLFGTREAEHKVILEKVVRPGMTIFDIGANIGYYALMELGLIGPQGRLVAIEPSPQNVALLRRNLALNGHDKVPVIESAVSDTAGERLFHLSHQSNLGTFHDTGSGVQHLSGQSINVPTMTVARIAEQHGPPDLIRMDVEGHEVEVVGGMLEGIRAGQMAPMILFETHLSRYSAEHDMAAVMRALFACGYSTRYLASSSQRGTAMIEARGYKGSAPIATDDVERVIFENVSDADAIDFVCNVGGARTVLLVPKGKA